jgi:hypothetical protein
VLRTVVDSQANCRSETTPTFAKKPWVALNYHQSRRRAGGEARRSCRRWLGAERGFGFTELHLSDSALVRFRKGVPGELLVAALLEKIAQDNLYDAVLGDDQFTTP